VTENPTGQEKTGQKKKHPTGRTERPKRKTERFSRVPIFSQYLEESEIEEILEITEDVTYQEGEQIFQPGDANNGFYIVLSGRVEIRMPEDSGNYSLIATLSNRSVFGEMSFLNNRNRSAYAIATSATKLSRIDGDSFRKRLEEGNLAAFKVIHNFAQLIAMRLRQVEDELLHVLDELGGAKREHKLAELQEFRQKLFKEWSF
jgi:CRP-like cAMP-binding protein